jgi:CheY-like chemotaxis protein
MRSMMMIPCASWSKGECLEDVGFSIIVMPRIDPSSACGIMTSALDPVISDVVMPNMNGWEFAPSS